MESTSTESHFLPQGYLFDQLSTDPRWPHFFVAYQYYMNDKELESTGVANFGETFALYRNRVPFGGLWEFGVQGGVFSFFDLTLEAGATTTPTISRVLSRSFTERTVLQSQD